MSAARDPGRVRPSATAPAPLLPITRRSLWVTFLLAVANGAYLYFVPARAETGYAWAIRPPASAAFIGAGYLAGVLAAGLSLFVARWWRSLRALIWPFFVFGVVLFAATLVHADRFRWTFPPTWLWATVYVVIPLWMVYAWRAQEPLSAPPPLDPRLGSIRALSWPLGLVAAALGAALVLAPAALQPAWPWQITPLLGRVFGAWYLLMGLTLVAGALTFRQPHEVPVPCATITVWSLLVLLLPLRFPADMRAGYWLLAALHVALLAGAAWATARAVALMRAEGQTL